jgi:tape measure domain-containing protein
VAGSAGSIFVDLLLRDSSFKQGLDRSSRNTSNWSRGAKNEIGSVGSAFKGLGSSVLRLAATYGAALGAVNVIGLADEINLLAARIKDSTLNASEFSQAFKELSQQAIAAGTNLSNGVEIFQRLSFSRNEINATNREMLDFTETVQKLGVVSGASTQGLTAGLLQLGQGLSSGVLRAEEFNSILENIPAVGAAIAEEFGVSVGQLRALVIEGEVLSQDVFTAIISQQDKVNKKFEEFPVTLGRGFKSVVQAVGVFASELNRSLGITSSIGNALQNIGNIILDNVSKARQFSSVIKDTLQGAETLIVGFGLAVQGPSKSEALRDFLSKQKGET